jgi:hypothetical protein
MFEPSKAFGVTVGVEFADYSTKLDDNITSLWALYMTGIAVAVINPKANLYHIALNNIKQLGPNTYSIIGIERMEIDNSDKSSDFQSHQENTEIKEMV